jgi:hypothetical protein
MSSLQPGEVFVAGGGLSEGITDVAWLRGLRSTPCCAVFQAPEAFEEPRFGPSSLAMTGSPGLGPISQYASWRRRPYNLEG